MKLIAFIFIPLLSFGQLVTFPGAVGHGRFTTGGRGGTYLEVTNTNDSGAGSLRAALEASGTRTVFSRVDGTISLLSDIIITNGNLTFFGQTAPGDGIQIRDGRIEIQADNVFFHHFRSRPGQNADNGVDDALRINGAGGLAENIMIDHCSFSFGQDENIGIVSVNNLTVSNCLLGDVGGSGNVLFDDPVTNATMYRNVSVWCDDRNFRSSTSGNEFEMVNNYFYGWVQASLISFENQVDYIGNHWENETDASSTTIQMNAGNTPGATQSLSNIYLSDNLDEGVAATTNAAIDDETVGSPVVSSGITPIAASGLQAALLGDVGAGAGVATMGLDSYDQGLIDDITGEVAGNYMSAPYTYPTLSAGTDYTDSDNDGMDDAWETDRGLNTGSDDGNSDDDGDGYTNREEFAFYRAGMGDGFTSDGGVRITPATRVGIGSGIGKVIIGL